MEQLLPTLPELAAGLAMGLFVTRSTRCPRAGVYAGLVLLAALPLALRSAAGADRLPGESSPPAASAALTTTASGDSAASGAPRLLELGLPELWRRGARSTSPNLLTRAWQGTPDPQLPSGRLYVGFTALLLALLGAFTARGSAGWIGRGLVLVALASLAPQAALLPEAWRSWLPATLSLGLPLGLVLLAGTAVAGLGSPGDPEPSRATGSEMLLGAACVLLAGGLGLAAAWAGSATPRELLEPLLARFAASGEAAPGLVAQQHTAEHLVAVLDRAALLAFASMTALLLHLKGRRLLTLGLLVLVSLAELGWARLAAT